MTEGRGLGESLMGLRYRPNAGEPRPVDSEGLRELVARLHVDAPLMPGELPQLLEDCGLLAPADAHAVSGAAPAGGAEQEIRLPEESHESSLRLPHELWRAGIHLDG